MSEQHDAQRGLPGFLAELKRRHVVRFTLGYAAAAFVVLQLAEIVFPAFGIGETGLRVLVITVGLGFLPAAVLAWVFDVTPQGIRRTEGAGQDSLLPRLAMLGLTLAVVGSLGFWLIRQGVLTADPGASPAGGTTHAAGVQYDPSRPIRSIAVLPLDDFSPQRSEDFFIQAMHEELITQLSHIAGLRVVSRTTSARYAGTDLTMPQIGAQLGVDAIIEGSVVRTPERVRITIQLIHAPSDGHIGPAQTFEGEAGEELALQIEVAHAVAHGIREDLSTEEETVLGRVAEGRADPVAQEAYLRGLQAYDRGTTDGYRQAMEHFTDAVEADSTFAPALAGLAGSRYLLSLRGEDSAALRTEVQKARIEATQALALDGSSAEAREVLAIIDQSMPAAAPDVAVSIPRPRALETRSRMITMPGSFDSVEINLEAFDTAWVYAMTRLGEQLEEEVTRRTMEGPFAQRAPVAVAGGRLMGRGRHEEAARVLRDLLNESPTDARLWQLLVRAEISYGDPGAAAEAVGFWSRSGAEPAPSAEEATRLELAVELQGTRGYWSWTLERLEERAAAGEPVAPSDLAAAHAALGNAEEAFQHLFAALEQGDPGVLMMRSDPAFDPLRSDPRFTEISRRTRELRFAPWVPRPPRPSGGRGG